MPILTTVLSLVIIGVILWLLNTFIPMAAPIRKILNIFVAIAVILWLLYGYGVLSHSGGVQMPEIR